MRVGSRRVATASADKTVKIWDAGSLALLQTATFADKPAMEDMQVSPMPHFPRCHGRIAQGARTETCQH